MSLCTLLLHIAQSDPILKHELSSKYKALDCPRTNKMVCIQELTASFCPCIQGLDLIVRHCSWILALILEKGVCSHKCPASTILRHHARVSMNSRCWYRILVDCQEWLKNGPFFNFEPLTVNRVKWRIEWDCL